MGLALVEGGADAGSEGADGGDGLVGRCRFDFLDDAAADHDCVGHLCYRPGGRAVADAEADADRELHVFADRVHATGDVVGVDRARARYAFQRDVIAEAAAMAGYLIYPLGGRGRGQQEDRSRPLSRMALAKSEHSSGG